MEESLILLKEKFHLKETDANQYSPLVLAYLGDAVYEILIRTIVVSEGNMQVNKLHKKSSALVKAAAQAGITCIIQPGGTGGIPDGDRGRPHGGGTCRL